MSHTVLQLAYLAAAVLFILGLRNLSFAFVEHFYITTERYGRNNILGFICTIDATPQRSTKTDRIT